MYRPTVRYHDIYKEYVDNIFMATHLDRNQIIRAALFTAAHSTEFIKLMKENKRGDVPLPSPFWLMNQPELWMEQNPLIEEREVDVNVINTGATKNEGTHDTIRGFERNGSRTEIELRRQQSESRRERTVSGGIKIRIS